MAESVYTIQMLADGHWLDVGHVKVEKRVKRRTVARMALKAVDLPEGCESPLQMRVLDAEASEAFVFKRETQMAWTLE
jgi:hypothetical protein